MKPYDDVWSGYLRALQAVPFVRRARIVESPGASENADHATLEIQAGSRRHQYHVEHWTRPIGESAVQAIVHRIRRSAAKRSVLLAPYLGPQVTELLLEKRLNYVDQVGNLHLESDGLLMHVEGRKPERAPIGRKSLGANAYRVVFALLARPEKLNASIREIALVSGVAKSVVGDALQKLETDGLIVRTRVARRIPNRGALIERWVQGYADVLRPRLLLGNYRTRLDPPELESVMRGLAPVTTGPRWAWGGGAAAFQMGAPFRGEQTVIHLEKPWPSLPRQLEAVSAHEGNLVLLGVPGPAAFAIGGDALVHLPHPLLPYAELLALNQERAREAAAELRRERIDPFE